jgi:MazG family protein
LASRGEGEGLTSGRACVEAQIPVGALFEELLNIMQRLRSDGGCPWDREQNHMTIRASLLEEAREAMEAIERGDDSALVEELGDVLLQVLFHSQIAREQGKFDARHVLDELRRKLVRRHPHVFGGARAADASEVLRRWRRIKAAEKRRAARSVGKPARPRAEPKQHPRTHARRA